MPLNLSVFDSFPVLETKRLTLRDIRPEDATAIYSMRSSGLVNRFIARQAMDNQESSIALIERTRKAYEDKLAIGWAGVMKGSEAIIGTCGFNRFDFANERAEIGGEMSTDYWGKKLAVEAVREIVRFGLETIGLHSIEACLSPENKSAVFLLTELGFEKEAHFRDRIFFDGRYSDMAVYTLIKGYEKL